MPVQDRSDASSREIAAQPSPAQIERIEQTIAAADRHIALQEQRIKEATLAGRNTAQDGFELQKLQLLIAILREGRERLLERQARGESAPSQRARTARGWIGPDRTTPLNSPATVSGATAGRHRRCCHTRRGW